jgi:4-diphosphocytidyl-2-C-methyl-D-erythritol kinase
MSRVRVPAFAKINLCLDVLGKRPDGYHELRTIFQTISLRDTLQLEWKTSRGIELEISGNANLSAESPKSNLVYRALDALCRELRIQRGIRAHLRKRIPAGRGLGGGSSDAAAALLGLLRLANRKIPIERLIEIGGNLGADVAFFLFGGRAVGTGRGDEIYPLPDAPRRDLLVVSPGGISVPTRDAYAWLGRGLTKAPAPSRLVEFCALCWSPQETALSNDFEAAVFRRHPRLGRIKRELLRHGAVDAALAGSGSAVFGIFRDPAQARRTAHRFPGDEVFVCTTVSRKRYSRALGGRAGV